MSNSGTWGEFFYRLPIYLNLAGNESFITATAISYVSTAETIFNRKRYIDKLSADQLASIIASQVKDMQETSDIVYWAQKTFRKKFIDPNTLKFVTVMQDLANNKLTSTEIIDLIDAVFKNTEYTDTIIRQAKTDERITNILLATRYFMEHHPAVAVEFIRQKALSLVNKAADDTTLLVFDDIHPKVIHAIFTESQCRKKLTEIHASEPQKIIQLLTDAKFLNLIKDNSDIAEDRRQDFLYHIMQLGNDFITAQRFFTANSEILGYLNENPRILTLVCQKSSFREYLISNHPGFICNAERLLNIMSKYNCEAEEHPLYNLQGKLINPLINSVAKEQSFKKKLTIKALEHSRTLAYICDQQQDFLHFPNDEVIYHRHTRLRRKQNESLLQKFMAALDKIGRKLISSKTKKRGMREVLISPKEAKVMKEIKVRAGQAGVPTTQEPSEPYGTPCSTPKSHRKGLFISLKLSSEDLLAVTEQVSSITVDEHTATVATTQAIEDTPEEAVAESNVKIKGKSTPKLKRRKTNEAKRKRRHKRADSKTQAEQEEATKRERLIRHARRAVASADSDEEGSPVVGTLDRSKPSRASSTPGNVPILDLTRIPGFAGFGNNYRNGKLIRSQSMHAMEPRRTKSGKSSTLADIVAGIVPAKEPAGTPAQSPRKRPKLMRSISDRITRKKKPQQQPKAKADQPKHKRSLSITHLAGAAKDKLMATPKASFAELDSVSLDQLVNNKYLADQLFSNRDFNILINQTGQKFPCLTAAELLSIVNQHGHRFVRTYQSKIIANIVHAINQDSLGEGFIAANAKFIRLLKQATKANFSDLAALTAMAYANNEQYLMTYFHYLKKAERSFQSILESNKELGEQILITPANTNILNRIDLAKILVGYDQGFIKKHFAILMQHAVANSDFALSLTRKHKLLKPLQNSIMENNPEAKMIREYLGARLISLVAMRGKEFAKDHRKLILDSARGYTEIAKSTSMGLVYVDPHANQAEITSLLPVYNDLFAKSKLVDNITIFEHLAERTIAIVKAIDTLAGPKDISFSNKNWESILQVAAQNGNIAKALFKYKYRDERFKKTKENLFLKAKVLFVCREQFEVSSPELAEEIIYMQTKELFSGAIENEFKKITSEQVIDNIFNPEFNWMLTQEQFAQILKAHKKAEFFKAEETIFKLAQHLPNLATTIFKYAKFANETVLARFIATYALPNTQFYEDLIRNCLSNRREPMTKQRLSESEEIMAVLGKVEHLQGVFKPASESPAAVPAVSTTAAPSVPKAPPAPPAMPELTVVKPAARPANFLAEISKGANLRAVTDAEKARPTAPNDLISQIKQGKTLRKVNRSAADARGYTDEFLQSLTSQLRKLRPVTATSADEQVSPPSTLNGELAEALKSAMDRRRVDLYRDEAVETEADAAAWAETENVTATLQ